MVAQESKNINPAPSPQQASKTQTPPIAQVLPKQPVKLVKDIYKKDPKQTVGYVLGTLFVILAGVGTGYMLSGKNSGPGVPSEKSAPGAKETATEAGLDDESTFRDVEEGVLQEGGIDGEGTHYLDRDLGEEKYVYLTSTVIDLQSFVGKKVKIWGETNTGQKAGYLMDVGKIKVIE